MQPTYTVNKNETDYRSVQFEVKLDDVVIAKCKSEMWAKRIAMALSQMEIEG